MSHSETKPIKIAKPKLPKQLSLVKLADSTILDRAEYGQAMCQEEEIMDVIAEKVTFDQMVFENITFSSTSLLHAELTDVVFKNCDLSNVNFSDSVLHRVQFTHCKIIGIDLTAATMRNVSFQECAGDYATFRFANMKNISFQECSLIKSDFYHSEFAGIELIGCMIDGTQFTGAKLKGIDLSQTEFYNLGVTMEDLQGCIIAPAQALLFSKIFGLVIKE
ncbi:hypothetical protein TCA2_0695 [Paenibacillus sp. TCA20]|uniref:Pentapeptide repeat-containing protein n=1 Tax=Paenibacillus urinalis TaxID=521520 RepID=A0AAX3N2F3_9BACL|nr:MULTISPECIES: pentapeptide repeat-containing protein [Paenibacillus]WDH84048.1 pentapeptide repeat-containing protein [Paenibacillus urinalis]GAK38969.1 hypothetical protein TCA2_0695 [Paenibacillus sp. TCA20]